MYMLWSQMWTILFSKSVHFMEKCIPQVQLSPNPVPAEFRHNGQSWIIGIVTWEVEGVPCEKELGVKLGFWSHL